MSRTLTAALRRPRSDEATGDGHPPIGTDRALRRDLTTDAVINTATAPSDAMNPTDPGSASESPRATNATLPGTIPIAVPMT